MNVSCAMFYEYIYLIESRLLKSKLTLRLSLSLSIETMYY